MMFKARIFLLLFILFGCGQESLINENLESSECRLYLFPIFENYDYLDKKDFLLHKPVLMDSCSEIQNMISEWKGSEVSRELSFKESLSAYSSFIVVNDSIVKKFFFNPSLSIIKLPNKVCNFDSSLILDYKEFFKNISGFKICVTELSKGRKLVHKLDSIGAIVPQRVFSQFYWETFSGEYIFKRKEPDFPSGVNPVDSYENIINKDFSKNIFIKEIKPSKEKGYSLIKLRADSLKSIPKKYSIVKNYDKFDSVCFKITAISKGKINEVINNNEFKPIIFEKIVF